MAVEKPDGSEDLVRFSSMTSSLHKALECPICLEVVQAPVRMCSGGHITCSTCADRLPKCSICQQNFSVDRLTFINGLLEVLPRFCKYSDNGCKQVCVAGDKHEDFCAFRDLTCREKDCGENVPLCRIREHYGKNHPDRFLVQENDQTLFWENFDPAESCIDNSPIFVHDQFFIISLRNDSSGKYTKFTFEAFISGMPKCTYFVIVTIDNDGGFVQKKTVEAIVMKGDRDDRGLELISETENPKDYYFEVSHKFYHSVFGDERYLEVNFEFLKL